VVDLTVRIGDVTLANPVMPGSGTFSEVMDGVIDLNRLGALVTKTITPDIRDGNPQPRVTEYRDAMLSSIGIPSKGPDHYVDELVPFYRRFSPPLVASVSAPTVVQFGALAARLSVEGVSAIEANISCPNLEEDGRAFAMHCAPTEAVIRCMKAATDRPVWAKLTPNVGDIAAIARAAEAGGADALVVANAPLGMAIDTTTFRPRLGSVFGGLTGPAIKPINLRFTYQCARAVAIPVIGCGGIASVEDAVEYMLAGASAVQIGTASFIHPTTMIRIIDGLPEFCRARGLSRVANLTGAMRRDDAGDESAAQDAEAGW
jgi:dihydroorotate dehydrogenase (NAD+) catalytic subunit